MQKNKVINNAIWIVGCRIVQSILSLIISMLTARYLGPSNYGIINYAAAIVAFVVPIMQLGFRNTLVREFVKRPEKEGEILGTALVLNLISAFICIIGVIAFVSIANKGEKETIIVCSLYSLNLIFQALEMSQYWYQAKLYSKYTSIVSLCAYVIVSLYRIFLLVTEKSIYWFSISHALDFMIIAVLLLIIYRKVGNQKLSFSLTTGSEMLSISKHYIISSMMVTVFGHIASILLKFLMDDAAVGFYTAAVSCAGMTGFVFSAIVDSARPIILESKYKESQLFEKNVVRLYSLIIYISVLQGIFLSAFASIVVRILYGSAYGATVNPLRIMAWYTLFSNLGTVRNVWILAEGKQRYLWIINFLGVVVNVTLNLFLIPVLGILGAALASVITQFFTNVLVGYILKPVRYNNRLMLRGINPKYLFEMTVAIIGKYKR